MQSDSLALEIGEDGFAIPLDAALRRIALLGQRFAIGEPPGATITVGVLP